MNHVTLLVVLLGISLVSAQNKNNGHTITVNTNKNGLPVVDTTIAVNTNKNGHPVTANTNNNGHTVANTNKNGHPFATNTNNNGHTVVDSTNKNGHTVVANTNNNGHTVVANTNKNGHPVVDTTNNNGHTVANTNKNGHPVVDNTNKNGHPVVDTTKNNGHTVVADTNKNGHTVVANTNNNGHTVANSNEKYGNVLSKALTFTEFTAGDMHVPVGTVVIWYFNNTLLLGPVKFVSGPIVSNPFHNKAVGFDQGSCTSTSVDPLIPLYCVGTFSFMDGSTINWQGITPPGGKVEPFSWGINSGTGIYDGASGSISGLQSPDSNQWIYHVNLK